MNRGYEARQPVDNLTIGALCGADYLRDDLTDAGFLLRSEHRVGMTGHYAATCTGADDGDASNASTLTFSFFALAASRK